MIERGAAKCRGVAGNLLQRYRDVANPLLQAKDAVSAGVATTLASIAGGALVLRAISRARAQPRAERPRLVWGPEPLLNYKWWSRALQKAGHESATLVTHHYSISERQDFDFYYDDIATPSGLPFVGPFEARLTNYRVFAYAIERFDVFHHSFRGGFLAGTLLERLEPCLLRLANKLTVIIPYGGDAFVYSSVSDLSLRHVLIENYPDAARQEPQIRARRDRWNAAADCVIASSMTDGSARWDLLAFNLLCLDVNHWAPKRSYSQHDGLTGPVRVLHAPNHRAFKGTRFVREAVEALRREGLDVELVLIEGKKNEEIRRLMREEVDLLAEQLIFTGYSLNAVEGMACGLPVLSNLDSDRLTRVFRRFSFLNECPVLSTTPETMLENLRLLVTNPALREELGTAGRSYAVKYHSEEAAQHWFGKIYELLWSGRPVDLMDFYTPTGGAHRGLPPVAHPLLESRMRPKWLVEEC